MSSCRVNVEPCHVGDCDGFNEVSALLPRGPIWNPSRGGEYGAFMQAKGDIKTQVNQRICQEFGELNPCTATRLLPYWASVWSLPSCVEQTPEKLCEWIALVQGDCPPGSLGFLCKAVEFVAPGVNICIGVDIPNIGVNYPTAHKHCAEQNTILITAPPEAFFYADMRFPYPRSSQDGQNPCRMYFIPEIECLRDCIFPFGLSVGYQTNPLGPNGEDIYNVPLSNIAPAPDISFCR